MCYCERALYVEECTCLDLCLDLCRCFLTEISNFEAFDNIIDVISHDLLLQPPCSINNFSQVWISRSVGITSIKF